MSLVMKAMPILLFTLVASCMTGRPKRKPAAAQSCANPFVAARLSGDALMFAVPDGNSSVVESLGAHAAVCADPEVAGFNFRRVMLEDGTTGYVSVYRLE